MVVIDQLSGPDIEMLSEFFVYICQGLCHLD